MYPFGSLVGDVEAQLENEKLGQRYRRMRDYKRRKRNLSKALAEMSIPEIERGLAGHLYDRYKTETLDPFSKIRLLGHCLWVFRDKRE